MNTSIFERGFGATLELFAPIAEVKASYEADQRSAPAPGESLTDYERHVIAMHEFPEVIPVVQQIAESVEVGDISESQASNLFAELALRVVCADIARV